MDLPLLPLPLEEDVALLDLDLDLDLGLDVEEEDLDLLFEEDLGPVSAKGGEEAEVVSDQDVFCFLFSSSPFGFPNKTIRKGNVPWLVLDANWTLV